MDNWGCTDGACIKSGRTSIGVDRDNDGVDQQCGDSTCENAPGVADATKTQTETACSDGLDNDCDGTVDGADSDCCTCTPGQLSCQGNTVVKCNSDCRSLTTQENCDSRDGWVCSSNVREYKDYGCGSGVCSSSTTSSENCIAKASEDSDGSSTNFETAGTVTDYTACSPGGCTFTPGTDRHTDACAGTRLTEYAASGASYTSLIRECQDFETLFCNGPRQYRKEWGCSGGRCLDTSAITREGSDAAQDRDGDGTDAVCGDSQCDNSPRVYDNTKTATETACSDGLNNDCDTEGADCADSDCLRTISGTVTNEETPVIPVQRATVTLASHGTTQTTATDSGGAYSFPDGACNTVTLEVRHSLYSTVTENHIIQPSASTTANFRLAYACDNDCTSVGDAEIHRECWNTHTGHEGSGCAFYDAHAADICDGRGPNDLRIYDDTHYIRCANGGPVETQCTTSYSDVADSVMTVNRAPITLELSSCTVVGG